MKNLLVIIIVLFSTSTAFAQKEFNNWYFGDSAGITFNTPTGEPVALLDGVLYTYEGCSAISDSKGDLLFYTNGVTVWNRFHKEMKNGKNLFGHSSSTQSALIVPKPGSDKIFYIFTNSAHEESYSKGFNYSIVDLSLENGSGDVTQKNVHLLDNKCERVSAVEHKNEKDIWILTQSIDEQCFVCYLLTENGLENLPVKSPTSIDIIVMQLGVLKFSPNGNKLVCVHYSADSLLLYDFNKITGQLSNEMSLFVSKRVNEGYSQNYSAEFSENGQFLYVSAKSSLYQFDISSNNLNEIQNSKKTIVSSNIKQFWALEMGPNKKIYIATQKAFLSVIHEPNKAGIACNLKLDDVDLRGRKSVYGLPTVVQSQNKYNILLCEGDILFLIGNYYIDASIQWEGPQGFNSNEINPVIIDTKPEMSGSYYYKIIKDGEIIEIDSVMVTINPRERILFENNSEIILTGNSVKLKVVENPEKTKFKWYGIDSDENEITITKSGIYTVVAENESGCKDSVSVKIKLYPAYCIGNDVILDSYHIEPEDSVYNTEYLWSGPNDFTSSAKNPVLENVSESYSGNYGVRIITKFGTGDFEGERDTIFTKVPVFVYGDLGLEISAGKMRLCDSDSTDIYPTITYSEYLWSTGEITETILVRDAGVYQLIVKNELGCSDSAEITISKFDAKLTYDKAKLMFDELCIGDSESQNLKFTVETNSDLLITNIYTKSGNFAVLNSYSLLKTYKNGESADLEVIFNPKDGGELIDTLIIESAEPCIYRAIIPIYGSSKAFFRFALPDIATEDGRRIEIPVNSALICPNANKLTTEYEIEISVDKAYFLPDSVLFGEIIENNFDGNNRVWKIKASVEFEKFSGDLKPVNIIYGQALIGRSETVPLIIQNVTFTNDRYYPEYQNGSLKIDGCVNDLTGIQIFKPTTLKVAPNPADGDLKVSVGTQEEGSFSIIIYDFQGREVAKSEFSRPNKIYEETDYSFNISGLGTGVYSVHLTAPWTMKREQLLIVK